MCFRHSVPYSIPRFTITYLQIALSVLHRPMVSRLFAI